MPDIDVDFCQDQREKVIEYVVQKYGRERVCQIITFGTMKAKAVVRDVGRALNGLRRCGQDRQADPGRPEDDPGKGDQAGTAAERDGCSDPQVGTAGDAICLEGLARHAGTHAAGVVVAPDQLEEYPAGLQGSEDRRHQHPVFHEVCGDGRDWSSSTSWA
jgi:DNA polymerase III subunit alpha